MATQLVTCFEGTAGGFPVKLEQNPRSLTFTVTYGCQVWASVEYGEAAVWAEAI